MDLIQVLARASRKTGATVGTITALSSADGTATVTMGDDSTVTQAYLTDSAASSATVGARAVLLPIGDTLSVIATMGGSTVPPPNLVPNGDFSQPGDGMIPTGWVVNQDGSADLDWFCDATAGPNGGSAGVVLIHSLGTNTSVSVMSSPNFTIDGGETYTLSFSTMCDPTVTNCIVWPSITCYSTADNWWGQNVSNGVLSPNVGNAYGAPYTTDLPIPADANKAFINLGMFCDTTSTGRILVTNVSLRRTL